MIVNKNQLFRKMLFCPRLSIRADGEKIRCAYVYNERFFKGWVLEDDLFNGKTTKEVVDYIFENYREVELIWSRKYLG